MALFKNKIKINPFSIALVVFLLISLIGFGGYILRSAKDKNNHVGVSSFIESSDDGNKSSFSGASDATIENVAKKLSPSVVSIVGVGEKMSRNRLFYGLQSNEFSTSGTGVIATSDGYIITNKHVVDDTSKIQIILSDGSTYDEVRVAAIDPLNDIAYLKVSGVDNLSAAELGDSKTLSIGQEVIAIGNALGEYQGTVTSGIISGVNRNVTTGSKGDLSSVERLTDMIQTDAAINSGNSGGPLVNARGQVIGINTAVASDANGIGFAIPVSATKGMLKSLVKNGSANKASLGMNYISVTPAIAKENNLSVRYGAWITSEGRSFSPIVSGGAADRGGIKEGDIIISVNEFKVGAHGSVFSLISEYSPGEEVELGIVRGGKNISTKVKLDSYRDR